MKILQVITSLQFGGAEKLIAEIAPLLRDKLRDESLERSGELRAESLEHSGELRDDSLELRDSEVQVDVCSFVATGPNLNKVLEAQGIKVINFADGGSVYKPSFIWKLAKLMKGYDVVHTHNTACQMFAAIAKIFLCGSKFLVSGSKCPKLVTTEHSTSTRRRNYKIFKYIDRWMYSRYDKIICISEPSEESLRGYLGSMASPVQKVQCPSDGSMASPVQKVQCPSDGSMASPVQGFQCPSDGSMASPVQGSMEQSSGSKYPIVTIKNGVNIRKFMDAEPVDLGLGDCKKITMVAGFRYEKDQPTVIKALKYLPEDYHVVLVGDGAERQNLELIVESLELRDRVHFLGLRNDVPNILKASDVIVMSSHREGLSLSNVEGMCSGHPFVASDVEGLREVTKGYGLLFPHGDSKALADIILKLCTDKSYADEVAARCKERAMQYDIEKMVEGYQKVYMGLFESL